MSTTVERLPLVNALRALRAIAGTNPALPILANVAIRPHGNVLILTTTNLEVYAERQVTFSGDALPHITVPVKPFSDFASGFSGDTITLDVDEKSDKSGGSKLRLSSGRHTAKLSIMDADEFPVFPSLDSANSFTITREEFDGVVERIGGFAASDTSRPILTGVAVRGNGENIRFAAADNYRVGVLYLDHNTNLSEIVVPATSLVAAQKVLGGAYVSITTDSRVIMLTSESGTVLSRLVEGQYPNIDPILPSSFKVTLLISQDDLAQTAKLAALANAEVVRTEENDDGLRVFASDYDKEFDATLEATFGLRDGDKEKVRFALNSKFFLAIASVFADSTVVEVGYGGPLSPVAFRDPEDQTFRAVVMPVRTGS